jgi:hypothetical protein
MSSTIKFVSVPAKRLASSISGSATSFKLSDILGWDGANLTFADFGDRLWVVFRNSAGTLMEIMEVDPTTVVDAATPIDIIKRGLKFTGDQSTEVSANKLSWVKGDTIVELGTDVPQLLEETMRKSADESITGKKTFLLAKRPALSADSDTATAEDLVSYGQLSRTAISGGVPASASTKGISKLSVDPLSPTDPIAVGDNDPRIVNYYDDTGAADAYVIAAAISAYAEGQRFSFRADNPNTGASTLNVNAKGAKTIKKYHDQDLVSGDIEAGQIVVVEYDGTNFQLITPPANSPMPLSYLDTDAALAADSDAKVASQKATKAYVTNQVGAVVTKLGGWTYDGETNFTGETAKTHTLATTYDLVRIEFSFTTDSTTSSMVLVLNGITGNVYDKTVMTSSGIGSTTGSANWAVIDSITGTQQVIGTYWISGKHSNGNKCIHGNCVSGNSLTITTLIKGIMSNSADLSTMTITFSNAVTGTVKVYGLTF